MRPGYRYPQIVDDDVVLERARSAKNGARFRALFDEGGLCGYATDSEADQALSNLLAFWTRRDREQMDRLFRRSARMRDKWNRQDYRDRTIGRALDRVKGHMEAAAILEKKGLEISEEGRAIPSERQAAEADFEDYKETCLRVGLTRLSSVQPESVSWL